MQVTDKKLRDIMNNLITERGLAGAIEYVSTADYPTEITERAMLILKGEPTQKVDLLEHGDISDASQL